MSEFSRPIYNTMDSSVELIPDTTVTLEEYNKNKGVIQSAELSEEGHVAVAANHADGTDVIPLHRSTDSSAEATRTERRLHPYTFRN